MNASPNQRFHLHFAPEQWTAPGKFLRFLGPPFEVSRALNDAVRSCVDHLQKYETFARLATDVQATLREDVEELERDGYTPGHRSEQFAAIVEVLVCELYSVLDGVRHTLYVVYKKCRGVQQSSTSKLISRAAAHAYGPELPESIRCLLAEAHDTWFFELRRLRTAFIHGGLGSCSLSRDSDRVTYMNPSLGTDARAHVIEDIVTHVNGLASAVFALVRGVFEVLFAQLEPVPSDQVCGIYKNRFYMRVVVPTQDMGRSSGVCKARLWFDSEPDFRCPLAEACDAYRRAIA